MGFTADAADIAGAAVVVVAVPTPVDPDGTPNLGALQGATRSVGQHLTPGTTVVFESTVYPGCTEEVCLPILEEASGLTHGTDFFIGYSPERINPGDTEHTFESITKVVSGSTPETAEFLKAFYDEVVTAGTHLAPSIKVAEASKIMENTQRDVNIALMNEFAAFFEKMGVNPWDVLQAAGTKWNFLKFFPGLVGGHCIGVDPYYAIHKAAAVGVDTPLMQAARVVNEGVAPRICNRVEAEMATRFPSACKPRVLVLGVTFKENVSDVRNSKAVDIVKGLEARGFEVEVFDPLADKEVLAEEYDVKLVKGAKGLYHTIVHAVPHSIFTCETNWLFLREHGFDYSLFFDVRGNCTRQIPRINYATL